MRRKERFEIFLKKVSKTLIGENVGTSYDCSCDLLFDFEEAYPSNSKLLIKCSSLLMWIMLLKIFYLLILSELYL